LAEIVMLCLATPVGNKIATVKRLIMVV